MGTMEMKKREKIYIIILLLLFSTSLPINGDDKTADKKLSFTIVPIHEPAISNTFLNSVSDTIKKYLKNEDLFIIKNQAKDDEKIVFNNCIRNNCIDELRSTASDGIVILISLSNYEIKTGEKYISKYITESIVETRFTIHVAAIDLLSSNYDLLFKKTSSQTEKIISETNIIGSEIREFYLKKEF